MPSRRRATNNSSSCNLRTCLTIAAGAAILFAYLRFTTSTEVVVSHRQFRPAAEYDRIHNPQAAAAPGARVVAESTAQPVIRQHEIYAVVKPPAPLTPLLTPEAEVDAPEMCRAKAHTELEGGVVKWGDNNRFASAGECCASCSEHAKNSKAGTKPCNIWVFCADRENCGQRFGQCWLKHTLDPSEPPSRGSSLSVPWTSGTILPQPAETYRLATRMRRAERQRQPLTMLVAAEMHVGLRNETGTIELLTPLAGDQPHFSFPLPLTDVEVNLGREHLDRTSDGYHHFGDLTFRATPRGGGETICSSVGNGQVATDRLAAEKLHLDDASSVAGGKLTRGDGNEPLWSHSRHVGLKLTRGRTADNTCPLTVTRRLVANRPSDALGGRGGGSLDLIFEMSNPSSSAVEMGALGVSMPFDQDFVGRTLVQVSPDTTLPRTHGTGTAHLWLAAPPLAILVCCAGGAPVLIRRAIFGTRWRLRSSDAGDWYWTRPPPPADSGHRARGVEAIAWE